MKTYVLIISENFPAYHPLAGEPTNFIDKIKSGEKIHTIRSNYDLWERRIEEVNKGNAIISVRSWTGKPCRSKQKEHFKLGKSDVGIEGLIFMNEDISNTHVTKGHEITFYNVNRDVKEVSVEILAKNDGLPLREFIKWFENYDLNPDHTIIHFTNFRYV